MNGWSNPVRRRRRVAIDAAMVLVILVLIVQMWLLTATLESFLAGHRGVALPALLSSVALFAICLFLYLLVLRIDRMPDGAEEVSGVRCRPLADRKEHYAARTSARPAASFTVTSSAPVSGLPLQGGGLVRTAGSATTAAQSPLGPNASRRERPIARTWSRSGSGR